MQDGKCLSLDYNPFFPAQFTGKMINGCFNCRSALTEVYEDAKLTICY